MKKEYVIFGVSAFLSDIIDIIHARGGVVSSLYMNMPEVRREGVMGFRARLALLDYRVEVHETLEPFKPRQGVQYVLGTTTPHKIRLVEELRSRHALTFTPLLHPTVYLGSNVRVGEGVLVNVSTVIAPNAVLGDFCVINRGAMIGHETRIGRHALIGPAASLAGSVTVGDHATVALRATVIDQVQIGDWTVVGAGSLVTRNLPERVIAYGVPAKVVRVNDDADFTQYHEKRAGLR
jgi:sugar O-acyltransferase (sialic acid O-acetyltransferase NeuD family)